MARRGASSAEQELWRAAMRDVRRLRPAFRSFPPAVPAPQPLAAPPATAGIPLGEPVLLPASRPGPVDRATEERLRRGRVTVDARIDLHGMTQAEAFPALLGFLTRSVEVGRRTVLIITGKGPAGQGGVLRRNAPGWLMASPLARRILTIVPAHVRHGGDGAFYVMLRRDRSRTGKQGNA